MDEPKTKYRETARDRLPGRQRLRTVAVLLPLVMITLSEAALFAGRTDLALLGHFLTLLVCSFAPLFFDDESLILAFGLVSLFRLINLGSSTFVQESLYFLPLPYAFLFPAVYIIVTQRDGPVLREKPRHALLGLLPAIVLGAALAEIEYRILTPESLIPVLSIENLAVVALVMFAFVGLIEEILYRGILQPSLQDYTGRSNGIILTAVLYGMMHSAYGSPLEIAFAVGLGMTLGLLYDVTDSLALVTIVHGTLNVFLFAILPLRGSVVAAAL